MNELYLIGFRETEPRFVLHPRFLSCSPDFFLHPRFLSYTPEKLGYTPDFCPTPQIFCPVPQISVVHPRFDLELSYPLPGVPGIDVHLRMAENDLNNGVRI